MTDEFDPTADAAYFEIAPGILGDYDAQGHLIGLEVLSVSKRVVLAPLAKAA